MDPTAPKDNPQNPAQDPLSPAPASPPNSSETPSPANAWSPMEQPQSGGPQPALTPDGAGPILPGQFVITGEDSKPKSQSTSDLTQPQPPTAAENPLPANPPSSQEPSLGQTFANTIPENSATQDQLITPPNPKTVSPDPLPPVGNPPISASQPDPTPFMPPTTGSAPGGFSKTPGSGIKKLRTVVLVLGVVILLMILGVIAWFFFFADKYGQAAKVENQTSSEPAINQQPIPKRGTGGFDEIQQTATTSSQPQQSTPAASIVPTP